MRIHFNDDVNEDIVSILAFLDGLGFNEAQQRMAIDISKIRSILNGVRQDFPHKDGLQNASIFKKVANFVVYFISERPIQSDVPSIDLPEEISSIPNHVNTLVALFIAIAALHEATIHGMDGEEKQLKNKIELSKHSFIDLVEALSSATPNTHFKLVSVLFEQLAYKSNPECQYQPVHQW
jgi:hypothetical protein